MRFHFPPYFENGAITVQDVSEDLVLDADTMTEILSKYFKNFDKIMASMGWIFDPEEVPPARWMEGGGRAFPRARHHPTARV